MPIDGIVQPDLIEIDSGLRLRKYDGIFDFALSWYQDPEVVWLVDGVREPYTLEKLERMYRYLDQAGEAYWIEICEDGFFRPVGDVTFWQEDMPIVIGDPACRGRQIGRKVISALAQRARKLGWKQLQVDSIYHYNLRSRKCFEAAGFRVCQVSEKGVSLRLNLTFPPQARQIMQERFGRDSLLALATVQDGKPYVRTVDALYEDGAFYIITHAQSQKMKQISSCPQVAVCGDWFTAQGIAENLGHILLPSNRPMLEKLRTAFAAWYGNGHVNEQDPNTCLLKICLTEGVLMADGNRFDIDFTLEAQNNASSVSEK